MAILKWIQFSDLHLFYRNFDTSLHRRALIDKLQEICSDGIDMLFITGDIGYRGKYDDNGIRFLKEMVATVNCPLENIFIVPGNHDLRRSESRDAAIKNARADFENIDEDDWDFPTLYCFRKFAGIYEEITNKKYSQVESGVCHVESLNNYPLNIIHINTSAIAGRDDDTGNLRVCNSRFVDKLQCINKSDINIAIGHHGLEFLHNNDKIKLLQCFNQYGIMIYLCGHSHKLGEEVYGSSSTFIFQELTCGGLLQDDYNESSFVYGTINIESKLIHADLYQYSKQDWKKISELSCPIKHESEMEKPVIMSKTKYDNWLNYFVKYFKRVQNYGDIYSYLKIDEGLFADLETSYNFLQNVDKTNVPLLNCIFESWNLSERNDIIVVGDGGMGKTVSLLKAWEFLLIKKGIFSLYISLFEINGYDTWFVEYLHKYVFLNDPDVTDSFIKHMESLDETKHPCCVLFLDGFNEVDRNKQINIIKTIRNLKKYTGYQIVVTSRFDFSSSYGLDKFLRLTVKPLRIEQINSYLRKFDSKNQYQRKMINVLEVPLMLTLFTQTARLYRKYLSAPQVNWQKNSNTKSSIIYNYLQCQIAKQLDQLCTPEKTFMCCIAINYILPYMGWRMWVEDFFQLKRNT